MNDAEEDVYTPQGQRDLRDYCMKAAKTYRGAGLLASCQAQVGDARLFNMQAIQMERRWPCPECGTRRDVLDRYCAECGFRLIH